MNDTAQNQVKACMKQLVRFKRSKTIQIIYEFRMAAAEIRLPRPLSKSFELAFQCCQCFASAHTIYTILVISGSEGSSATKNPPDAEQHKRPRGYPLCCDAIFLHRDRSEIKRSVHCAAIDTDTRSPRVNNNFSNMTTTFQTTTVRSLLESVAIRGMLWISAKAETHAEHTMYLDIFASGQSPVT